MSSEHADDSRQAEQPEALDVGGLTWDHAVTEISGRRSFRREATAEEREIVSRILGDAVCQTLRVKYAVDPKAAGLYRVYGEISAEIEQTCGVTLDPVVQHIDEAFDVEFRNDARRDLQLDAEFDALGEDDPEPIERGLLRVGRYTCEIVASLLDPFPRAPDAELEQSEAGGDNETDNPFAALAKLKNTAPGR